MPVQVKLPLVEDFVRLLWVVLIDVCCYPTQAVFSTSGPAPLSHDEIPIRPGIGVLVLTAVCYQKLNFQLCTSFLFQEVVKSIVCFLF